MADLPMTPHNPRREWPQPHLGGQGSVARTARRVPQRGQASEMLHSGHQRDEIRLWNDLTACKDLLLHVLHLLRAEFNFEQLLARGEHLIRVDGCMDAVDTGAAHVSALGEFKCANHAENIRVRQLGLQHGLPELLKAAICNDLAPPVGLQLGQVWALCAIEIRVGQGRCGIPRDPLEELTDQHAASVVLVVLVHDVKHDLHSEVLAHGVKPLQEVLTLHPTALVKAAAGVQASEHILFGDGLVEVRPGVAEAAGELVGVNDLQNVAVQVEDGANMEVIPLVDAPLPLPLVLLHLLPFQEPSSRHALIVAGNLRHLDGVVLTVVDEDKLAIGVLGRWGFVVPADEPQ
mmetsp:Transcript_107887/g.186035  ORF Transcript_107887/g.186035 Transcript_107887/m.186035 type:complete len:347 (+) Transcript_107887:1516-2556(+)